jgi:hypothetical protein
MHRISNRFHGGKDNEVRRNEGYLNLDPDRRVLGADGGGGGSLQKLWERIR